MELQVGVKAFIKNSKGQYLLLKRCSPYSGETECRWDIPGGRINPGEPLDEALAREIKEETNLVMKDPPEILYAQDILRVEGKHVVRLTFEVSAKGEVLLSDEHTEYKWMSKFQMRKTFHDLYLTPVINLL